MIGVVLSTAIAHASYLMNNINPDAEYDVCTLGIQDMTVIDGLNSPYVTGAGSQKYYIDSTGEIRMGGGSNAVAIDGGFVSNLGGNNVVYVSSDGTYVMTAGGGDTIYYEEGARIVMGAGGGQTFYKCGEILFLDSTDFDVCDVDMTAGIDINSYYFTGAGGLLLNVLNNGILDSAGGSQTIAVHTGGSVVSPGGSAEVYLETGSEFIANGSGSHDIYYEVGTNITDIGGSSNLYSCQDVNIIW